MKIVIFLLLGKLSKVTESLPHKNPESRAKAALREISNREMMQLNVSWTHGGTRADSCRETYRTIDQ